MAPRIFFILSTLLYHKWDVKNDFVYVLQFFSLISDCLGSVLCVNILFQIFVASKIGDELKLVLYGQLVN